MDENDEVCGETYDHPDLIVVGEDAEGYGTWLCRECGAEIDYGPED